MLQDHATDDYYGLFHVGDTGTRIVDLDASGVTQPVGP